MTKEEFNDQQFSQFTANMAQCENCGRKFLPDRLEVHLRSCKPGQGSRPVRAKTTTGDTDEPKAPSASSSNASPLSNASSPARKPPIAPVASAHVAPRAKLTPQMRALRRILFDDVDANKDGLIDLAELRRMVNELHSQLNSGADSPVDPATSQRDAEALMAALDINGDGVVDKSEWLAMQQAVAKADRDPVTSRLPTGPGSAAMVAGRDCPQCQTTERNPSAKFCSECGAKLPPASASGGTVEQANVSAPPAPASQHDIGESQLVACPSCDAECDLEEGPTCEACGCLLDRMAPTQRPPQQQASTSASPKSAPSKPDDADNSSGLVVCEACGEVFSSDTTSCDSCGGPLAPLADHYGEAPPSKGATGGGGRIPEGADAHDSEPRSQCAHCGRMFADSVLARHEAYCAKAKNKPRKTFDSSKARAKGTELAEFKSSFRGPSTSSATPPAHKQQQQGAPKWKADSEQFRKAMREARQVDAVLKSGGTAKDLPPPSYSENAHYVQCPHCGRRYAPDVAERHIPKCATIVNKPKAPPTRRR